MRRRDDVFFFTLIDLLVQVLFFGLFLFTAVQVGRERSEKKLSVDQSEIVKLKEWAGVSNITELTDEVTKLVPFKDLQGVSAIVRDSGGTAKLQEKIVRLQKLDQGTGKPSCLGMNPQGSPIPLATLIAEDAVIRIESNTPELQQVLAMVGADFSAVAEMNLEDFARTFAPVPKKRPDCRYTVRLVEKTSLVYARDTIGSVFYHSLVR